MADFNDILKAAQTARTQEDDTTRSIAGSPLVAGVSDRVVTAQPSQTIRISSGGDNSFQTGGNQDPRSQVPPSTLNKLPRVYGEATVGGVIVDARKPSPDTLVFAMVLSDMDANGFDFYEDNFNTELPPFECSAIYRDNDATVFDAGAGVANKVDTLVSLVDGAVTDVSNANIRVNVYAGNSTSSAQIFPGSQQANAYDIMPGWDANVTMQNTVFAIVQVTALDQETPEVKINNFGNWRFTINSLGFREQTSEISFVSKPLSNPAYALQDYLTNDTYGVGLTDADLDLASFTEWADVCDENMSYSYYQSGFQTIGARNTYQVGGVLDTQAPVQQNIDAICAAGQATFSYDNKQGKFKVLVNRQMTQAEQDAAFHFTGDNIVSAITVSTTDLYSLFNFAEVTFNNNLQLDAADTIFVETPTADKLQNEPTTGTSVSLALVNDRPRAAYIGNATLKQSRVGTVCQLTGDHSTMVVDTGDFVKITDKAKGWNEKFWRVMRIQEEQGQGEVVCKFTLAEYDSTVFDKIIYWQVTDDAFGLGVGEERFYDGTLGSLTFDSPYENFDYDPEAENPPYVGMVVSDWIAAGGGNVVNTNTGTVSGSVDFINYPSSIQNLGGDEGLQFTTDELVIIRTGVDVAGGDPTFSNVQLTMSGSGITTGCFQPFAGQQEYVYTAFPVRKLPRTGSYTLSIQHINSQIDPEGFDYRLRTPAEFSNLYTSASFVVNDRSCTGSDLQNTYGVKSQIVDSWPDSQLTGNYTGDYQMGTKRHDVVNHKPGVFTYAGEYELAYSTTNWSGTERLDVAPGANVLFVNNSNISSKLVSVNAPGVSYNAEQLLDTVNVQGIANQFSTEMSLQPEDYGLDSDWYASRVNAHILVSVNSMADTTILNTSYSITNQSPVWRDS